MKTRYDIIDFLKTRDIYIPDMLRERELYPFAMSGAKRFFVNFERESFEFDGVVKSMYMFDAKENLPRPSYAVLHLYSQSLDDLSPIPIANWPEPVGTLHLECGGERTSPFVSVSKWR